MDKIEKFLKKLSDKERKKIKEILALLENNNLSGLDIKKLKGHSDIFRVRKGDLRIVYRVEASQIILIAIDRRNEKTYKI
ncbi:MAG: type II toxin-antitoxin system RelE/ParE family toxin [Patescibacteria group bacterium]